MGYLCSVCVCARFERMVLVYISIYDDDDDDDDADNDDELIHTHILLYP